MKIIAGKFKGARIQAPRGLLSRPPLAVMREAIFNIVGRQIEGKRILDLFAGSGSLGIEALSRGASQVHFVDISRRCIEMIKRNLLRLNISSVCDVTRKDAVEFVRSWAGDPFDIVFIDPPFFSGKVAQTLDALRSSGAARGNSLFVARLHWREEFPISDSFELLRRRKFGESVILIGIRAQDGGSS